VKSDGERKMVQWWGKLRQRQSGLSLSKSDYASSRKEAEVVLTMMHRRQVFAKLRRAREELTS